MLTKLQELTPQAVLACRVLSSNDKSNTETSHVSKDFDESEDDEESNSGSNEKAYTLVMIADCKDFETKVYHSKKDVRYSPPKYDANNRLASPSHQQSFGGRKKIVIDQKAYKPGDNSSGFTFNTVDETGIPRTSVIGQTGEVDRARPKKSKEDGKMIGKIAFYRDQETETHPVEKFMGKWVSDFNAQVAEYCIRKPRYSELRPLQF